ncbi:Nuclear pore complex protein Nup50 [Chionoecetes opilio]|uniref:Nuclear pore complex protein Nup50 n=1 Tax=Chionoecetes opilio TaxID=41210 RepID=A0A8J4XUX2_CHIOP|nr:Nuclear pore complex protein Nup50 [Chionoecetes opilio]
MAKRGANKELNHENWEDEEEPEEMGTFRQASSDQLAGRQIRKARRRGAGPETSPGSGTGIFKGLSNFPAFGSKDSSSQPTFSFLSKDPPAKASFDSFGASKSKSPLAFTTKSDTSSPEKLATIPTFSFTKDSSSGPKALESKTNGIGASQANIDPSGKKGNKLFLSHLKSLNEGVVKWVKQHLDTNPHVNLSPVFDDYKKHFDELTKKYPSVGDGEGDEAETEKVGLSKDKASEKENQPLEPLKTTFSFGTSLSSSSEKSVFGGSSASPEKKTGMAAPVKPAFTFGSGGFGDKKSSEKLLFSGSSSIFGGLSSSSSSTTTTTTDSAAKGTTEGDPGEPTDEPPKVEVNEVKEEGAVYEKKCKLYYMKDGAYVEKGVGTVFLKLTGEKTQLLIRAYTNLGNILLNILLTPSIPTARAGKNGVMIACIPNPPLLASSKGSTETVKMLIRVKTAEDADALNDKINEHKK